MLDHYAIYGAGVLLGYKLLRTNFYLFLLGAIPAGFWHIPLFFALGASFVQYRTIEELTLFLGGLIAGGYIPQMKLSGKGRSFSSLYASGQHIKYLLHSRV
ncbi:DUF1404 family protein [Acidianus ambivalens]|uniref:DUF1404 family protein n=1 Tax=Acidianus ambivalens TaxID=2283 RepID=UPI001E4F83F0|nr:DUF1404 family protein [Acidianus ambivalens]